MVLGARFQEAVGEAVRLHAGQTRKGTEIPYLAHLLSTSALVLQFGGDEDQAIAALLHDAVEDAGGLQTLSRIRERFGGVVAEIVDGCTDSYQEPKPPWRARKESYIASLPGKSQAALLVSACDKLDNARAIVADLRRGGALAQSRFRGGLDTAWYYAAVTEAIRRAGGERVGAVVRELERAVGDLEALWERSGLGEG